MIFTFSHPMYLFLLLIIPLIFIIHFYSLGNRKRVALKFANFDAIARIKGIDFFSKNITILFLSLFIVLLITFAISGFTVHVFKEASSFSFVIAIDSSQSMEADDMLPSRLEVSKQTAIDFINTAPIGGKIGIVSFAGGSYIDQDLSTDKEEIKTSIDGIILSTFGGTDLYEAIITSSNLLQNEKNKAIILLSDGQINVGTVEDAVDYANKNNIIVHTIAIGTKEGGITGYGISKLDEDSLKALSYNTGGEHFNAEDKKILSQSFLDVLKLTRKSVSIDFTNYLLIFALAIFIFKFFLINTRYLNIL